MHCKVSSAASGQELKESTKIEHNTVLPWVCFAFGCVTAVFGWFVVCSSDTHDVLGQISRPAFFCHLRLNLSIVSHRQQNDVQYCGIRATENSSAATGSYKRDAVSCGAVLLAAIL